MNRQSLRVYLSHVGDMSSASSEQSCVHKGAGYNEVFSSGRDNPGISSNERNLLASSPSTRDEDLDTDGSESDFNDGQVGAEPPTQSVIGPNGLGSSSCFHCGWSMISFPPLNKHILIRLGRSIRHPSTYPSVYPTSPRSVTIGVLMTSRCMRKC